MKRLAMLFVVSLFSFALQAQIVDTTVCDILKNPASFDGKIVRVKGTVSAGFDQFILKGSDCGRKVNAIWLSYPEGSKAKAGPAAMLNLQPASNFAGAVSAESRQPVTLEKNKDFKQFDSALSTPYKPGGMCLGCIRYEVSATLVGRLDGTTPALRRDPSGKIIQISGFGNLNAYAARLVIQSVSELSSHEVDYSKTAAITREDSIQESSSGDPIAAAHRAASAFGPGNPVGNQIGRAADAFGKEGEDNGVDVGFSGLNEVSPKAEAKSNHASPDGVLFNCAFDENRLTGDALGRAIVYTGELIADMRDPSSSGGNADPYDLTYRAWTTTAFSAIAVGQKTLTLPGGYLLWNIAWPATDRNRLIDEAITGYLANEALLGH